MKVQISIENDHPLFCLKIKNVDHVLKDEICSKINTINKKFKNIKVYFDPKLYTSFSNTLTKYYTNPSEFNNNFVLLLLNSFENLNIQYI